VPLHQIAKDAAAGRLNVKPARIFRFDEIREAHRAMEANEARGKMVVVHD
jgi:NADPH:quinone reductase-like Zn-dependent oxidoreductase